MHRFTILVALLFAGTLNTLTAQSSASLNSYMPDNSSLELIENENWSFFIDEDEQVYYIDFETLHVNLSNVVVKNEADEILLNEDVFDLPVNTIYEIDFSDFGTGKYVVEMRSFTGVLKREVEID